MYRELAQNPAIKKLVDAYFSIDCADCALQRSAPEDRELTNVPPEAFKGAFDLIDQANLELNHACQLLSLPTLKIDPFPEKAVIDALKECGMSWEGDLNDLRFELSEAKSQIRALLDLHAPGGADAALKDLPEPHSV